MSTTEDKPAENGKENASSWKDSIYNPRTGEFIGRTGSSWGLILLFYLVFYTFLAGMFTLTMWVMLLTLDDDVPKYRDRVPHPGLVIRPGSYDITFSRSSEKQYLQYTQPLETFLQQYNDTEQEMNTACTPGVYFLQDTPDEPGAGPVLGAEPALGAGLGAESGLVAEPGAGLGAEPGPGQKRACQFKRSALSLCSGLYDKTFGYADGKPCVLLKMNRIIGLKPRGNPRINCTAKRDTPVLIQYFPSDGQFDKMYFPYYGKKVHERYVQPLVAVKLMLAPDDYDRELTLECRVEGSDLKNDDERDKFLGRVTFRVKVLQ